MNMKYLFSFLCLCCVLSVSAQKPVAINLAKAISESPKEIMLNELASDIRYVPLETTDDCLMNNEFYIMQYTGEDIITSGIFHFDKNGKFLNKIGSKGQGPEEYLQGLFAFGDWKNKLLYVQNWTTLTCYGFDGTFVRSVPTPQLNMGAAGLFDENHILYSNDIYYADKANPIQLYMVDSQNGKTVSKWRGHLEENKKYGMILTSRDFMYNYDNSLFYKPALENVIFKILSPKKRQLVYKFDCSGKDIDGRFSRMYCNVCRPVEKQTKTKHTCQEKYGVDYPCLTKQCIDSNIQAKSKINEEFIKQLESNNVSIVSEKQLGNYYYDLFIPETKTLIEINPTVTHTIDSHIPQFRSKSLNYHLDKTNFALNAGFSCINVWDWDDISKIIQNVLPNKHKLYARNLKIEEIDKQTANVFIDKYHLQNSCRNNTVNLGLYNNNQLVQVMTFGKPRYNKNYQYELLRLCSHSDYIIVGGAEKLFKYFINNYNPESVISYCDVSKFSGSVYYRLCFQLLRQSVPQIIWSKPNSKEHITDNLLRQRGFDQLFGTNYGKGTDNKLLMLNHGWLPICDCGQKVFVWLRKESVQIEQ